MTTELARRLRGLHERPPLVLPNAWDAGSAQAIEEDRAAAIVAVRAIVAAVSVPVTADIESGYGDVEATVAEVIEAGAVGINIEDSCEGALIEPALHAERITAARSVAVASGIDLVINARTDTYLFGDDSGTLERAKVTRRPARAPGSASNPSSASSPAAPTPPSRSSSSPSPSPRPGSSPTHSGQAGSPPSPHHPLRQFTAHPPTRPSSSPTHSGQAVDRPQPTTHSGSSPPSPHRPRPCRHRPDPPTRPGSSSFPVRQFSSEREFYVGWRVLAWPG